jgi:hypothetical protein
MSRNFTPPSARELGNAEREQMQAGDLDANATLTTDHFVDVYEEKASKSNRYAPGVGVNSRNQGTGFADLDLEDSGTNTPDGIVRWVLYKSSKKETIMRKTSTTPLSALRAAVSESYRDKELMPLRTPFTEEDRVLALQVRLQDGSAADGNDVSPGDSSTEQGIPYSRISL